MKQIIITGIFMLVVWAAVLIWAVYFDKRGKR